MNRGIRRAALAAAIGTSALGAQDGAAHPRCRDQHPAPVCASYFLFEFNAASRTGGTKVVMPFGRKDNALDSWVGWDVGWMVNRTPTTSLGGALEIGGSSDGVRVAIRGKARRWLQHRFVADASLGPLMSQFQTGDGERPTFGLTADVGLGRARLGLVTIGADMAMQNGSMQFANHIGGRAESTGAVIISAVAAVGGFLVLAGFGGVDYHPY
jgi:hypothetical protein